MPTLLVSGFEPFGGEPRNPAGEIAEALAGSEVGGCAVNALVLPVEREAAWVRLDEALRRARPAAVLGLGLALESPVVHVEQVAVNLEDYAIPDHAGAQPRGEPVVKGGPDALLATLPVGRILEAIRGAGVPAAVSRSAGAYLCNRIFYLSLHAAHRTEGGARHRAGFLHLPPLPEAVAERDNGRPSMSLDTSLRAVQAALAAIAATVEA